MSVTSIYPVLMSRDVDGASAFYRDVFGFEVTFEADWYVSLRLGSHELAFVDARHASVPEGYAERIAGVIVNLEVDDVAAVHERVVREHGLEPVLALRDEAFGQRHFIVEGPERVLVDVIQPIEPSPEFAAAYSQA
ncbi:glyoxalase [Pseudoclavibacter endophyticus]|uniref:Glyoxalase n=1 Tax=Pseudoclavibacter endophyticus TaxID=1778590 RepID=A0A6H9WF08_9MICO|nr:VOC family protein [Pseudoclavibacter endophyticus]KAB1649492.1 glyoxalase [Pseudoclavibacter endophyticus]GGA62209.1 glyoxalase [Pseudoclavibacter endophyticus]